MRKRILLTAALAAVSFLRPSISGATITLFLNEANCVTGSKFLESKNSVQGADTGPLIGSISASNGHGTGVVEGNGQNWIELVVGAPASGHTVDLSGYKLIWSDFKDAANYSSGTITFNTGGVWTNRSEGSIIGINEWRDVYYATTVDGAGEDRNGGYDGFGLLHDSATGTHLNLHTNTASFNGAGGVWTANFFAGDDGTGGGGAVGHNTGSGSYATSSYFSFSGSQTTAGTTAYIGDTSDSSKSAGLFVVNNNDWNLTIEDSTGAQVGPLVGESEPNWSPSGGPTKSGVNSQEVLKLEPGQYSTHDYTSLTNLDYASGKESTYMATNVWSDSASPESLSSLQSYSPLPTHW